MTELPVRAAAFAPLFVKTSSEEDRPPRNVVRYFGESRKADVESGEFWFSRVSKFRGGEAVRLSDNGEGVSTSAIDINTLLLGRYYDGLFDIQSGPNPAELVIQGNTFESHHDPLCLCTTKGSYNIEHHRTMLNSNPELVYFIEFDLMEFLVECSHVAMHHPAFSGADGSQHLLLHGHIVYKNDARHSAFNHTSTTPGEPPYAHFQINQYLTTIFHKPHKWSYEQEYRIVLRLDAVQDSGMNGSGLSIKSPRLRSLYRIGRISD